MKISLQDFGLDVEKAPLDVLYSDGGRNYLLNSDEMVDFEEQDVIPTTVEEYLPQNIEIGGRNLYLDSKKVEIDLGVGSKGNVFDAKQGDAISLSYKDLVITDGEPLVTDYTVVLFREKESSPARYQTLRIPLDTKEVTGILNFDVDIVVMYTGNSYADSARRGGYFEELKLEKGDIATDWTPAPEDFNNLKGKSYALSQPLGKENTLSLNGSFEEDDFIGLWLGDDKFVGFLDNQKLTFDLIENYDDEFVIVKTLSEKGIIDNAKLEKDSVATPWSPAWEDLPSEDKPVEYATFENEVTYQNNGYFKGTFMGNGTVNGIDVSKKTVIETYDDIVITGTEIYAYNMTQEPLSMKHILLEFGHRLEKIAVVGNDDISDIVKEYKISMNSDLWRTGMKEATLKLDGRHSFEDFKDGVDLSLKATYENLSKTHDFGRFYLIDKDMLEYNDVTQETTLTLYDSMIKAHQEFLASDIGVSFPTTIKNVVDGIAGYMGLVVNTSYPNSSHVIEENKWENNGLTYRDALDDIAVMANAVIGIFENKLQIKGITQNVIETINRGETSLKHESKWGKPNVLNLTREPQHDNYAYPTDWQNIPKDERIEIVFENNQIIDKRREELAPTIFNQVKDIEYTPFEYKGYGYLTMDYGDYVGFTDRDNNTQYSYVTQLEWHVTNGFTEMLGSELTSKAKEEYVLNTDQRKLGMQTYFLVDQQNGLIQGLIQKTDEQEDSIVEIRADVESIGLQVETANFGSILVNGSGESNDYSFWKANVNNDVLVPFVGFYPLGNGGPTTYTIFQPLEDDSSLSGWKISFFANGQMMNGLFPVLNEYTYSYRVKRTNGTQNFTLEVHEFDSNKEYIKKQVFLFDENKQYEEVKDIELGSGTKFIGMNYVVSGVTQNNRLELTETMFNIGGPKPYVESTNSVKTWAESQFTIQDNKIESKVSETLFTGETFVSMINQTSQEVKILANHISLEGLTTINGNFKVLENGDVEFINAKGTDVDLTGTITATSGEIGNFDLIDGTLRLIDEQRDLRVTLGGKDQFGNSLPIWVGDASGSGPIFSVNNELDQVFVGRNLRMYSGLGISRNVIGINDDYESRGRFDYLNSFNNDYIVVRDELRFDLASYLKMRDVNNNYQSPIASVSGGGFRGGFRQLTPDYGSGANIGSSDNRYSSLYLQNQPNVSSDLRHKFAIQDIPNDLIERLSEIKPKMYLQNKTWHFGYIAQDVERALFLWATKRYGIDAKHYVDKFAMLHKDTSMLSLLYGELAVLKEQQLQSEINDLKERLDKLETKSHSRH